MNHVTDQSMHYSRESGKKHTRGYIFYWFGQGVNRYFSTLKIFSEFGHQYWNLDKRFFYTSGARLGAAYSFTLGNVWHSGCLLVSCQHYVEVYVGRSKLTSSCAQVVRFSSLVCVVRKSLSSEDTYVCSSTYLLRTQLDAIRRYVNSYTTRQNLRSWAVTLI